MATIDDLPQASASADTDELLVSQNGIDRKVTRAQLVAGLQPQMALSAGQLLGRTSAGTGAPETIVVGANLALANGLLSGTTAPFSIVDLPGGHTPGAADLVPFAQDGSSVAITYGGFMAGLSGVPGIPASALTATATGATASRTLADSLADAVSVEAYGAVGDGVADDGAALAAALASGRPVRLGPKTYGIAGQWTITAADAVLLGVPGQTVLRRVSQAGNGAWISVQGAAFRADGILFDANSAVTLDSWGVLVTASCLTANFRACGFTGAAGATLGSGLVFLAADPALTDHVVQGCEASFNAVHGIWVQALRGVQVLQCRAHDNGQYGIVLDYTDPSFVQKVHRCQVMGCEAWNNARGISVGNFNATNTTPPVWGNANPDAHDILISGNSCHDNTIYGIAASGRALALIGNLLTANGTAANGGAGILANVSYSRVAGNIVTASGQYGIDAGGSIDSDISGNLVDGAVHGINPGGSQSMRISGNRVQDCTGWAILVNNVETDGVGNNFGLACSDVAITDNWIAFAMASGGGVLLTDAPSNVLVARNCFVGLGPASIGQCLWANAASVQVRQNSWNFQADMVCNPAAGSLVFPDVLDGFTVNAASAPVISMTSLRQQALAGQIAFIAVTAGGSGYSQASVGIGGGAAAQAVLSNGALIGVVVTNPGSGYTSPPAVTITGDGTGAAVVASIGLPVPEGRRLAVRCTAPVTFARSGSSPLQENWTLYDATIPANTTVHWIGTGGAWHAEALPLADYLVPSGSGGLTLHGAQLGAQSADGQFRIASSAAPIGITISVGHGSPVGVVSAPPGSDYRNLDGGAFTTLWIKQSGSDANGWVAIA
ncbi:MAG: right-handed parallel beta-helix repeat-containing protein [Acidisphaera sp.]|nr:right-handed parallel beta-helix repeat-containing protein [Acidisphaera sp.]